MRKTCEVYASVSAFMRSLFRSDSLFICIVGTSYKSLHILVNGQNYDSIIVKLYRSVAFSFPLLGVKISFSILGLV